MEDTPDAVVRAVERWEAAGCPSQAGALWRRDAWLDALPEHRPTLEEFPRILDREAVERLVGGHPETSAGALAAFLVTMTWGFSEVGYGPHRVAAMLGPRSQSTAESLLQATLAVRTEGPLAGYAVLAGPGRINGLGPAFGTKFLFFQSASTGGRRALILDRLISGWIAENCELHLNAARWSVPTYASYLERMQRWAGECGLDPATLEMVLFMEQATKTGGQWASSGNIPSIVSWSGDPSEFDNELLADIKDPDDPGRLEVPPGLFRRLLADPAHAAEHLAASAADRHCSRAQRDVQLLRERNPGVTDRQLAVYFKRKYSRAARWEGASTGAAGIFALPADLALLAWIQTRLVLSIAACYGHDMNDHLDRAADLLIIQGVHNTRELARKALIKRTTKAASKLVLRHLRKRPLILVKQLFRIVGIDFTRKALLEKGVPLLAIPVSATVNDASTRLLANRTITFYDTDVA